MNKLKLSALLLGGALSLNAHTDTTCTMVTKDEVLKFDYYASKIINRKPVDSVNVIKVKNHEVLCLHLYTKKRKKYKIITLENEQSYSPGDTINTYFLKSKNNTKFITGPCNVIVFTK